MSKLSGSRFIAEAFAAYGVTHFFYEPVVLSEAIKEMADLGINAIMTHGEKAAAYMADGYARISGRPGLCGCQAIGATNLAAGLRDAYLSRNPVIAISGGMSPSSRYRFGYQEIDDMPIFEAITKFNVVIERPDRLPDLLQQAFRSATTGMPQPVHLEMSGFDGGLATGEVEHDLAFDCRFGSFPAIRQGAPAEDVEAVLQALAGAERPIIVAGGGTRSSRAMDELLVFARRHAIPVATSLNAKGVIPDNDPLSAGVVGDYSRSSANRAVLEADLVFYIGSLTGGLVTRNWTVPPRDRRIVHLDINPENIGRNYPHTLGLCGDAKTVLGQLIAAGRSFKVAAAWPARIATLRQEWLDSVREYETSDAVPMRPERLCRELSSLLPRDAIVVGDTGHAGAWIAQNFYTSDAAQHFIRAHGSLGWAFPAAIGAKCAAPERPVICFAGDGGFYYHMAEMETAMRYGINLVLVVNNNGSLNQEQHIWKDSDRWDRNWRFSPVDLKAVAEGFGWGYERIERPQEIAAIFAAALAAGKPVLIDAVTDRLAMAPASVATSS